MYKSNLNDKTNEYNKTDAHIEQTSDYQWGQERGKQQNMVGNWDTNDYVSHK